MPLPLPHDLTSERVIAFERAAFEAALMNGAALYDAAVRAFAHVPGYTDAIVPEVHIGTTTKGLKVVLATAMIDGTQYDWAERVQPRC